MPRDLLAPPPSRGRDLFKEKESWYEDFGEGMGVSGLETY